MTLTRGMQEISAEIYTAASYYAVRPRLFLRIDSDPEVTKYIGAGNPRPRAETKR